MVPAMRASRATPLPDRPRILFAGGGSGGHGGKGATADFLSGLMGSLPAMHELAAQAGIELPGVLGRVVDTGNGLATAEPLAVTDGDEEGEAEATA